MDDFVKGTGATKSDVIVLGAGIIGTSIALHLARRGVGVTLVDTRGPGEGTSYGNAGVIEGNTIFPPAFPSDFRALLRIALKRATEANYHLSFLPQVAPWLLAYRVNTRPEKLVETAHAMRPLFERAVVEHLDLMDESNAAHYMCSMGWLKVYRTDRGFESTASERTLAKEFRIPHRTLDQKDALKLEPSLSPVFQHAILWTEAVSIIDPLKVTQAYARCFQSRRGRIVLADARTLERSGSFWRISTSEGYIEAKDVVVALGPWTPDILRPLGINLPLGIKRGYHHHFARTSDCNIRRPILDTEVGYCMTPMVQQGMGPVIRLTTGAEFASRDAPPTPVQFDRLLPKARQLISLGEPLEEKPWMGCRPCFADSKPVIGPAPGQSGMWLAYGHAHWGLTLGPATGRLVAELITKAKPFCDPTPYRAERFT
ncbi:MAG: FAD-binding oxidoreductase [bacterium]|nr:FAD-binding oxidoreductase [bacterium]